MGGGSFWNNRRITAIQPNAIYINDSDMTFPWSWDGTAYSRINDSIQFENIGEGIYWLRYDTSTLLLRSRSPEDVAAPLADITLDDYRQQNMGNGSYWDDRTITDTKPEYIAVTTPSTIIYYIWNLLDAYVFTGVINTLRIEVIINTNFTYTLNKTGGSTGSGQLLLTNAGEEEEEDEDEEADAGEDNPADAGEKEEEEEEKEDDGDDDEEGEAGDGSSPSQAIAVGTVQTGSAITIDTFDSVMVDTEIGLYDSNGDLLAQNDDPVPNPDNTIKSVLTFTTGPGTYYVAAGPYNMIFHDSFDVDLTSVNSDSITLTINRGQGSEQWDTGSNASGPVWFSFDVTA